MGRGLRPVALPLIGFAAFFAAGPVDAHAPQAAATAVGAGAVAIAMIAALVLYLRGVHALWRAAGPGRGVVGRSVLCFVAGWLVLGAALFGPVERASGTLFYAHMIQHELLMLVAAPLLVIGAPLATWSWSLPAAMRRRTGRVTRSIGHSRAWRALASPVGAWAAHAIAVCGWHLPAVFGAALSSVLVHDLQHASFLVTALLFWWSLLRPHATRRDDGVAVLLLFTTMLYTGALGALLAFSAAPWYADYQGNGTLSALEDQQLGGLIMWLPGGVVYAVAALALLARCIGIAPRREPRIDVVRASPLPARR